MSDQKFERVLKPSFIMLFILSFFFTPGLSLLLGIIFSLTLGNPFQKESAKLSKNLLKLSVIGLGFGVDFFKVIEVGKHSILFTFVTITATIIIGLLLNKIFRLDRETSLLITFGTSICGGSAIAALAPSIQAKNSSVAISLSTVFLLNAVALFIFPSLGHILNMNQQEFGIFSALAIHDTSSVVGAASVYGTIALSIAVTVKLARALWIAPFSFGLGSIFGNKNKMTFPLFILGFIAASFINSLFSTKYPLANATFQFLYNLSKHLLVMTLFLIGAGITKNTLKETGVKPLFFGITIWFIVSLMSFATIKFGIFKF